MTSLVSIVMPCHRHEAFVADAIRSVLAQTHADWELIAIDDASPDGTYDVLRAVTDPRIRVFRHAQNRGAHATIQEGIELARGHVVTILNSDDVFAPDRLARLLAIRERTGADVVGTEVTIVDAAGAPAPPTQYVRRWYEKLIAELARHRDLVRALLGGNVFMTTSNLAFTRELARDVGSFEPRRYTHDYAWLLRAVELGKRLHLELGDRSLSYRFHGANTISEAPLAASYETFDVLMRHRALALRAGSLGAARAYAAQLRVVARQIRHETKKLGVSRAAFVRDMVARTLAAR